MIKVGSKEWKKHLEDKCRVCNHRRGFHNDVGMCSACWDEDKGYKRHKFMICVNPVAEEGQ